MKLSPKLEDAINKQINMELNSSYTYLGMSAYCERKTYRGSAQWFRLQSSEERGHAMKLFDFMVDRNATIRLDALPNQPTEYDSLLAVFRAALAQEEKVSQSINDLYELALAEKSYATAVELQWFLTEQVEEEKSVRDIVARLEMVQDDPAAILDLDESLGGRSEDHKH